MIGRTLALLLVLQSPTVVLMLRGGEETITVERAQTEYRQLSADKTLTNTQYARLAALVLALGSRPINDQNVCATPLCETRRGRRLPLQAAH